MDVSVDDFGLLDGLLDSGQILRLKELLEDILRLLLQLVVDQVLEGLSGDTLHLLLLALLVTGSSRLLALVLHFLVDRDGSGRAGFRLVDGFWLDAEDELAGR